MRDPRFLLQKGSEVSPAKTTFYFLTAGGGLGEKMPGAQESVDSYYPDGTERLVLDSALRARFRDGLDHEVMMKKGEVYKFKLDLWSTSLVFNTGHLCPGATKERISHARIYSKSS